MCKPFVSRLPLLLSAVAIAAGPSFLNAGSGDRLTAEEKRSMQRESRIAIEMLQDYHYKKMPFVEVDSRELLMAYIESLDEQRMFLLQSDVNFVLERFERNLKPSYLFVGDLYPAFEIYDIYDERVRARLDWIAERLEQPFEVQADDTIDTDRSEADWPATKAEADALWEKRLKFDIIAEILEGEKSENAQSKIARRYERRKRFLEDFEPHNIQETFLTALSGQYDPHSSFFSWDSAQEFDIEISNSLIGIGAQLRDVEGYCVVERVLPGGPAEQSGQLHPGDRIVAVGQGTDNEPVDVIGMKLRRIVHLIRGEQGTTLRLLVETPGSEARKTVTMVRDRIELAANLAKAEVFELPGDEKTISIGVIELPSFYGEGDFEGNGTSTSQDVHELINKLMDMNIGGLVLDLRRNGGGRLDEAIALTGLFIEEGPVVMKRGFDGNVEEDWDRNKSVAYDGPLVVLTSKLSASASEIMAGALQSYDRAIIVGDESTYGKGTVQTLADIKRMITAPLFKSEPKWGMLKLTIQQFYLPDGSSTQKRGVLSDIVLPSLQSSIIKTEADHENALEWDSIAPISFGQVESTWEQPIALLDDKLRDQLRARSLGRQLELPEFELFQRELAWRDALADKNEFSLNLNVRRKEKETNREMRNNFENARRDLSQSLGFDAHSVSLAVSEHQEEVHQQKLRETPLPNGQPRMNQFYQKVFYYEPEPNGKIEEVWVEYIDYEDALAHAAELATAFSQEADVEVTETEMRTILQHLRNADRANEFIPAQFFARVLGDKIAPEQIDAGLPAFFRRIVELDEDILRDRPILDIHLRESLRIVNDWIELTAAEPRTRPLAALAAASQHESAESSSGTTTRSAN